MICERHQDETNGPIALSHKVRRSPALCESSKLRLIMLLPGILASQSAYKTFNSVKSEHKLNYTKHKFWKLDAS